MFREEGFGLLEVLLGVAVVALAIVPLAGMFGSGAMATHQVVHVTQALQLAGDRLELLRARPYEQLAALPASRPIAAGELPEPFRGEIERRELEGGDLTGLVVRIRWDQSGEERTVSLGTLVQDPRAR